MQKSYMEWRVIWLCDACPLLSSTRDGHPGIYWTSKDGCGGYFIALGMMIAIIEDCGWLLRWLRQWHTQAWFIFLLVRGYCLIRSCAVRLVKMGWIIPYGLCWVAHKSNKHRLWKNNLSYGTAHGKNDGWFIDVYGTNTDDGDIAMNDGWYIENGAANTNVAKRTRDWFFLW